jgi:hypothetical protein
MAREKINTRSKPSHFQFLRNTQHPSFQRKLESSALGPRHAIT